jgi:hypothetical protein
MYRGKGVYYIPYVYIGSRGKGVPNKQIKERKRQRRKRGKGVLIYIIYRGISAQRSNRGKGE